MFEKLRDECVVCAPPGVVIMTSLVRNMTTTTMASNIESDSDYKDELAVSGNTCTIEPYMFEPVSKSYSTHDSDSSTDAEDYEL